MRRMVYHHRFDRLRRYFCYELRMCGQIALVFFASCAIVCLIGIVILLVKLFASALVVVQP